VEEYAFRFFVQRPGVFGVFRFRVEFTLLLDGRFRFHFKRFEFRR
jgi:hypothetical protein